MFKTTLTTSILILVPVFGLWGTEIPFNDANTIVSSFNGAAGIALGDLNGNGTTDITIAARDDGAVRHYSNIGSGSWAMSVVDSGLDSPYSVAVGDIDGDGDGDILLGQLNEVATSTPPFPPEEAELIWYANPKNGSNSSWTPHGVVYFVYDGTRKVALGDMDNDGDLDAVVSYGGTYGGVEWIENDGDPTDGWGSSHPISNDPEAPYGLAVADINGDGDLDVVLADSSRNIVTWYENDGTDYWTEQTVDVYLNGATDVAVGDLDGDGDIDVVAAGNSSDEVVQYLNSGTGVSWTEGLVDGSLDGVRAVSVSDMDADGDLDILAAGITADDVNWYENTAGDASTWTPRPVDTAFDGAFDVEPGDVDADGDMDVFASGFTGDHASFWRNRQVHRRFADAEPQDARTGLADPRAIEIADVNGDGLNDLITALWDGGEVNAYLGFNPDTNSWWTNEIATGFTNARNVSVADMDGDGDLDVLGAAVGADAIRWWENGGGFDPSWTQHTILSSYNGAHAVVPADFDGDGDLDVMTLAFDADQWHWIENLDGAGTSWDDHVMDIVDGAFDVAVGDLNFDGTIDAVVTGYYADTVRVALSNLPGSSLWDSHSVTTSVDGPRGVDLGDVDGDGDLDVVVVVRNDDDILWFENDGTGSAWTQHNVGTGFFDNGVDVKAADIDGDGDVDVVATNQDQDDVYIWENTGDGASWTRHTMEQSLDNTWAVDLGDLDNDGKVDIAVAAGGTADSLVWYENTGDQFTQGYYDYAPSSIANGDSDQVLGLLLSHEGRLGHDADLEPSRITLEFSDGSGTPLTSAQVNSFIERLELYRDTNDDVFWDGGDTLVATDTYISLSSGVLSWTLPDGAPELAMDPDTAEFFFLVVTADPSNTGQVIITAPAGAVEAQDATYDLDLVSEPSTSEAVGPITIGSADEIFSDGFESGNLTAWSSSVGG